MTIQNRVNFVIIFSFLLFMAALQKYPPTGRGRMAGAWRGVGGGVGFSRQFSLEFEISVKVKVRVRF